MNITDDVYTIYRDGITPTEVPRVDFATGKLLEVLVQINEASAQGFVFTDTHVYIPFREHIRGQFAYSNAVTGDYHAGILNQFVGPQKDNGRLGVDPVVLTAEKWHTLHYKGSWDQITPPPPVQDEAVVEAAREIAVERHATVLAQGFASGIGADLTKGAQDGNVITDIFDYATATPDHRDNHQNDINALRQKLEMSNIPERRQDPSNNVHSFVGCHHLERMGGLVSWSEDEEGSWIPLDQPVVSITGLASHIPAKYSASIGTTVYMYDAETDTLEYYVNHNSLYENHQAQIEANDIYGPDLLPAALYVSPADGDSRILPPLNGRFKDETGPSLVAQALWNRLKTMPIDYTYFDRPTCPDSIRAGVDTSLKNFDSNILFETTDPAALTTFVAETAVPILTQALACTSHFNRDGYSSRSPFAFTGDVAFIPFAHGLLEADPDDRLAFLSEEAGLDDLLIGSERCNGRSEVRCSTLTDTETTADDSDKVETPPVAEQVEVTSDAGDAEDEKEESPNDMMDTSTEEESGATSRNTAMSAAMGIAGAYLWMLDN